MNRRNFLKTLSILPLAGITKGDSKVAAKCDQSDEISTNITTFNSTPDSIDLTTSKSINCYCSGIRYRSGKDGTPRKLHLTRHDNLDVALAKVYEESKGWMGISLEFTEL